MLKPSIKPDMTICPVKKVYFLTPEKCTGLFDATAGLLNLLLFFKDQANYSTFINLVTSPIFTVKYINFLFFKKINSYLLLTAGIWGKNSFRTANNLENYTNRVKLWLAYSSLCPFSFIWSTIFGLTRFWFNGISFSIEGIYFLF